MTLKGPFSISDTLRLVIVLHDCRKITMQHRTDIIAFGMLLCAPVELIYMAATIHLEGPDGFSR